MLSKKRWDCASIIAAMLPRRYLRVALLCMPVIACLCLCCFDVAAAQTVSGSSAQIDHEVRADMNFLAADDLRGRGSATHDEHIAALFAASRFEALGLEPGGDSGSFLQRSSLPTPLPAGVQRRLQPLEDTPRAETWNAIAILRGSTAPGEVLLLTAHLDHLGVGRPDLAHKDADLIYNGADDDASGVSAVLVLADRLARGPRPARTIVFALFGSEEIGGFGNRAFLTHPPAPLTSIIANLEFEMIGRPDPAVPAGHVWLTGYERSDLGPTLAAHGAPIVADPHPAEKFFVRSDNIALARHGIVAQTVSSFGLHKDYHRPSDDLSTIDFAYLEQVISAMEEPVRWLASTSWRPHWSPGGRPESLPKKPSTAMPTERATP